MKPDDKDERGFNELKAETEILASGIADMNDNLDNLSRNLESLMDCARKMFPEAYEDYLKRKTNRDNQ